MWNSRKIYKKEKRYTRGNSIDSRRKARKAINIQEEIELIVEGRQGKPLIIIGDFNGHVGFLGEHKLHEGGRIILSFMENHNVIMADDDMHTKGLYTWEGRGSKSMIDYTLINAALYRTFKDMLIDEKEIYDLSHHNIIQVRLKKEGIVRNVKKRIQEIEYYKKDEVSKSIYLQGRWKKPAV